MTRTETRLTDLASRLDLGWQTLGLSSWQPGLRIEYCPSGHQGTPGQYRMSNGQSFGAGLGTSGREAEKTLRRLAAERDAR